MKKLLIYYSYEGNTEALAQVIKKKIDCDVLKLEPLKEKKSEGLFRFVWGGIQVYMTKKPELKEYNVDLSKYDEIIIGTPCWFGTYAPPINTFINENSINNKNIYIYVCNGGNLRNTFNNFEKALKGNNIVSKIDFVYPLKNGIESSTNKMNEWLKENKL